MPTIGDLFPHDDIVSQWVFMLCAISDDLVILERALDLESGDVVLPAFQMIAGRLYEAERALRVRDECAEVAAFEKALVASKPDVAAAVQELTAAYRLIPDAEKGQENEVKRVLGLARMRSVHYSWPGSAELKDTLSYARKLPARVEVDPQRRSLRYLMTQDASTVAIWPNQALDFRPAVEFAHRLVLAFGTLMNAALIEHAKDRGVDLAALTVVRKS